VRERIHECLSGRGGEVTARARAAELGQLYLGLSPDGRERFLRLLAGEFGVDRETLTQRMHEWATLLRQEEGDPEPALLEAEEALRDNLTAPRVRLLRRFNALPQGVKFLVDLRAELMPLARDDAVLRGLEDDLARLLESWFDVGFLELRSITWDAPASLLEKLAEHEAVHEVKSWADIKNRLAIDRRCYAFFHPQMPEEPLIYVWVALVRGMASSVQALLDVGAPTGEPDDADTAIFYSISNAQEGLRGIRFGSFLIKQVVDDLSKDLPNLKTFATLSPIPGFRPWLKERIGEGVGGLLLASEVEAIAVSAPTSEPADRVSWLTDPARWLGKEDLEELARGPLTRLSAWYLATVKRDGQAHDRVAHFHLTNGARVERINWMGDRSERGLRQSLGLMVNYLYRSGDIESNHEAYAADGEIRMSGGIRALLKGKG
jgi:malonyl-CoA decarboxylase